MNGYFDQRIALVRGAIDAENWSSKAGASDFYVVMKIVDIAERAKTDRVSLSERQFPELDRKTVRGAIERLRARGMLRRRQQGAQDRAAIYHLQVPAELKGAAREHVEVATLSPIDAAIAGHPYFSPAGRGPAAGRVFTHLLRIPAGVHKNNEVARQLRMGKRTVSDALRTLGKDGLVHGFDDGTWSAYAVPITRLDILADDLGVFDVMEGRRVQYETERDDYRAWVNAKQQRRDWDDHRRKDWVTEAIRKRRGTRGNLCPYWGDRGSLATWLRGMKFVPPHTPESVLGDLRKEGHFNGGCQCKTGAPEGHTLDQLRSIIRPSGERSANGSRSVPQTAH